MRVCSFVFRPYAIAYETYAYCVKEDGGRDDRVIIAIRLLRCQGFAPVRAMLLNNLVPVSRLAQCKRDPDCQKNEFLNITPSYLRRMFSTLLASGCDGKLAAKYYRWMAKKAQANGKRFAEKAKQAKGKVAAVKRKVAALKARKAKCAAGGRDRREEFGVKSNSTKAPQTKVDDCSADGKAALDASITRTACPRETKGGGGVFTLRQTYVDLRRHTGHTLPFYLIEPARGALQMYYACSEGAVFI